ncbi:MAG: hypothetical protein NT038_09710 [Euryarchaeota archaeon]|nr:hypothetical protein [Euryarchaeota archaeon]
MKISEKTITYERLLLNLETMNLQFDEVALSELCFRKILEPGELISKGDEGKTYKVKDVSLMSSFLPSSIEGKLYLKQYHDYHWYRSLFYTCPW